MLMSNRLRAKHIIATHNQTTVNKETNRINNRHYHEIEKIEKDRLQFEIETKDRINISKKEYLNLLHDVKYFELETKKWKEKYSELVDPIIKPLISDGFLSKNFKLENMPINHIIGVLTDIPYKFGKELRGSIIWDIPNEEKVKVMEDN
jgi:hypothetical protein